MPWTRTGPARASETGQPGNVGREGYDCLPFPIPCPHAVSSRALAGGTTGARLARLGGESVRQGWHAGGRGHPLPRAGWWPWGFPGGFLRWAFVTLPAHLLLLTQMGMARIYKLA